MKAGDRVYCVRGQPPFLNEGEIYLLTKVVGEYCYIEGAEGNGDDGWYCDRFVPVAQPVVVHSVIELLDGMSLEQLRECNANQKKLIRAQWDQIDALTAQVAHLAKGIDEAFDLAVRLGKALELEK